MANTATQPADNWFVIGTASQLQIRYNLKIYDKGLAVMKFFWGGVGPWNSRKHSLQENLPILNMVLADVDSPV